MLFVKVFLMIWIIQLIAAFFAIRFRTDKLTDLAYGWTFFVIVFWLYVWESAGVMLHIILFALISLRSLRLAAYLFLRVLALWKDKRFDGIREKKSSFTKFWVWQWIVIFLLLVPVVLMFSNDTPGFFRYTFLWIGLATWGILLETLADWQKFRFKQQYPTRWCNTWVRAKLQYPNYLWEILVWIGIYLICLSSLTWTQIVLWFISPFAITRLLLFVTWIPPLEREHQKKWWDEKEWRNYISTTPKLLPWIW